MKKVLFIALVALTSCAKQSQPEPARVTVDCGGCSFETIYKDQTTFVQGVQIIHDYKPGAYLFINIYDDVDALVKVYSPSGSLIYSQQLRAYERADVNKVVFKLSIPLK